jgi:hypothetical protein
MRNDRNRSLLQAGGFSLHYQVGRLLKIGFTAQCFVVTGLCAIVIFIGSIIDRSLFLEGRNVGLLEHPAIWAFLVLQTALPLTIRQSVDKLQQARIKNGEIRRIERRISSLLLGPVRKYLQLRESGSKVAATIVYGVGLVAFVWNTYQNQLPGVAVPYDFWDSKTYVMGYWITRLYKFYLFFWLLPYIAMLQVAILVTLLRLVRRARLAGKLKLFAFHPDGVGGFGFVASLVSTPVIVTLMIGSIPTAAAFHVHRAADVTPLVGLAVLVGWALTAYLIPILFMRSDVFATKRETLEQLASFEEENYSRLIKGKMLDPEELKTRIEASDYFDKVSARVKSISNYPHLGRLLSYGSLAMTPSLVSIGIKLVPIGPLIGRALKLP